MHIIGTAGHVDHGKSSLVAALTGTNPDRWIEEQLRGMTLDLGFARLAFADGSEAGIIDVPGHERFLHNMLAGAAGMELLVLVVAANEGVMPQTREHLAILRYLNVRRALVAVSKIDLIEPGDRETAIALIAENLRATLVEGVPIVPVSTQTGEGLDEIREAIHRELFALPERSKDAPAFLPVDRVFALSGHGTIVTGTLMQGVIALGDQLKLAPQGRAVRVRSLQVFGEDRPRVEAGSRVAVNLPGVEVADVSRGDVLADAQFVPAQTYAVSFTPLAESLPLLHRRNPVRVYAGAAEILATLVFDQIPRERAATHAVLYLRRPLATYPNASFIVRRMSPKTLLGGGTFQGAGRAPSANLESHAGDEAIAAVLAATQLQPLSASEIAARANLREEIAQAALAEMSAQRRALALTKPPSYVDGIAAYALLDQLKSQCEAQQRAAPWILGTTSLALSRAFLLPEPLMIRLLAAFAEDGAIAMRHGYYATADHVAKLSAQQRAFFEEHVAVDEQDPYVPVPLAGVLDAMRTSKIEGLSQAFDTLLARGALIKVGDALYRGTQIAAIHGRVESFLREHKQMTMAQFRDLLGTSRKFAVPLLEWFDARGITVRSGDFRMLRTKRAS